MEAVLRAGGRSATVVHTFCDRLARAVRVLVILLAIVMLVVLSLQVVMRYVFNRAPSWSEELALACFSWSMLLALAAGVRGAVHVRMDLLLDRLTAPAREVLERLIAAAIGGAGAFIAWSGGAYVADTAGTTSAAIGYPMAWLYACAPACGALVVVFAFERAVWGPAGLDAQHP